MKKICFLILLFTSHLAYAQGQVVCNSDQHDDIDFWVGSWNLTWDGGYGTNHITKEYGGCVIRENFVGTNMIGMSVSSYNQFEKKWKQIWLDEQNSYLDLDGYYEGDDYVFHTVPDQNKPNEQRRMIFTDIKKDSLTWSWQNTTDSGATWQDLWVISYKRIK